jgi:phage gp29-like protein
MTNPRIRDKDFKVSDSKYSRGNSIDAFATADVLPNPDPVLNTQNSLATWQNFRNIFWDPHLTAVIASRKSVTLSKKWYIEGGKSPSRVRKFIEKNFENLDIHRATEEILDAPFFGMQAMEPIWGSPEGVEGENKIFCKEFTGRPAWWFQYDKENKLRFRSKDNFWPGDPVEDMSLIVARNNPKYENPYGEALLSKIYWSINFKKAAFKYWIEFAEKNGSPYSIGKVPRNAGEAEYDELLERLQELVNGSSAVIPDDTSVEFISSGSKSSADIYKDLMNAANQEISKAILGQTLTTESGEKGSRALGQVHDNVRLDIAEADEIMAETCFNVLIRWIVDINFGPNVVAPTFKYEHEKDIKKDLAERDKILSELGVKFDAEYFKEIYNLADNHFTMVEPVVTELQDEPEFREASEFEDQKALDNFINGLTNKELQKDAKFVQPLIKMIQNAKSFDEANEGLLAVFSKIRPERLEKNLGRALFSTQSLTRNTED